MKLSDWARQTGVSYRTAWRWVRDGKLPEGVTATRTGTGTILVNVPIDPDPKRAALFLLESDDEKEMSHRSKRVIRWLQQFGYVNVFIQTGPRSKLVRLVKTVKHKTIVVEAGIADTFALELLNAAMESSGRELLVYSDPRATLKDPTK